MTIRVLLIVLEVKQLYLLLFGLLCLLFVPGSESALAASPKDNPSVEAKANIPEARAKTLRSIVEHASNQEPKPR